MSPAHGQDMCFALQVVVICLLWYSTSAGQSIVNKLTLQRYPYPLTIALSSCLNNVIYAILLIKVLKITPVRVSNAYLLRTVVPISVGRAMAITSAYFALWKVSVSYAQTVKATMPIFTVIISRFAFNDRSFSFRVYLSLSPIVIGVFIATATEIQFDLFGLLSSLFSTSIFAFLNILAKKVFEETGMHPINLLALNSQFASVMLFPFWLLTDAIKMLDTYNDTSSASSSQKPDSQFLFYLLLSGLCSFFQNLCAFSLIHQLTTLSYSVSNTAKRIFVIVLSLATLKNPVTPLNVCGMMLSVLGMLIYNRVKSAERVKKEAQANGSSLEIFRRRESNKIFDIGALRSSGSDVRLLLSNS